MLRPSRGAYWRLYCNGFFLDEIAEEWLDVLWVAGLLTPMEHWQTKNYIGTRRADIARRWQESCESTVGY